MTHSGSNSDDLQLAIQQSLERIAEQMGEPMTAKTADQVYHEAVGLLSHLDYAPITLARVAGTLLVYQLQQRESEEIDWLKDQLRLATEPEMVEELLESISRLDSL